MPAAFCSIDDDGVLNSPVAATCGMVPEKINKLKRWKETVGFVKRIWISPCGLSQDFGES